jgi:hypothetical protein
VLIVYNKNEMIRLVCICERTANNLRAVVDLASDGCANLDLVALEEGAGAVAPILAIDVIGTIDGSRAEPRAATCPTGTPTPTAGGLSLRKINFSHSHHWGTRFD